MNVEQRPQTIAQCERCGRGFIYVNPTTELIDRYPRQDRFIAKDPSTHGECGGRIVMLKTHSE